MGFEENEVGMNFIVNKDGGFIEIDGKKFQFKKYNGETNGEEKNVTYIYVSDKPITRLNGKTSNILYIGQTKQKMNTRYEQEHKEEKTGSETKNSQATNIRLSHIFKCYGEKNNISCYFIKKNGEAISVEKELKNKIQNWNRSLYNALYYPESGKEIPEKISLEQYLLVKYADEHWELPPLNNRF